ncbi:MYXO-CTERM sorting domain-containing protein [Micromonospora zamorensis]
MRGSGSRPRSRRSSITCGRLVRGLSPCRRRGATRQRCGCSATSSPTPATAGWASACSGSVGRRRRSCTSGTRSCT